MFGIDPIIAWIALAIVVLCVATVLGMRGTRKVAGTHSRDHSPLETIEALSKRTPVLITKANSTNSLLWHIDYGDQQSLLFTKKTTTIEILLDDPFIRLELNDDNSVHMVVRVNNRKIRFSEHLDLHDDHALTIHQIFERIVPQIAAS